MSLAVDGARLGGDRFARPLLGQSTLLSCLPRTHLLISRMAARASNQVFKRIVQSPIALQRCGCSIVAGPSVFSQALSRPRNLHTSTQAWQASADPQRSTTDQRNTASSHRCVLFARGTNARITLLTIHFLQSRQQGRNYNRFDRGTCRPCTACPSTSSLFCLCHFFGEVGSPSQRVFSEGSHRSTITQTTFFFFRAPKTASTNTRQSSLYNQAIVIQ